VPTKRLRERPAGEIVILILASAAGLLIVTSGVSMLLVFLFRPEENLAAVASGIGDVINTIVGALIGYLAGTTMKKEPDDKDPPDPPAEG
jgi:glycopeptide antibiotics resistance protein